MSTIHVSQDAPRTISGEIRRTSHPRACTSAALVGERALDPVLEMRAVFDWIDGERAAIAARTHNRTMLDSLRRIEDLVVMSRGLLNGAVGYLDECQANLREAESRKDWSGLADLRAFTGREAGVFLRALLDSCEGPSGADARRRLEPWFSAWGEDLFSPHIEIGVKRRRGVLKREFDRWALGRGEDS